MLSKVTDPPTDSGPARVGECAGGGHGRGERVLRERVAHRSRRRRRRRDLRLREGRGRHTRLREPLRVGVGDGVPERALALLSFGGLVRGVLGAVPVERHAIRRGRFVAARGRRLRARARSSVPEQLLAQARDGLREVPGRRGVELQDVRERFFLPGPLVELQRELVHAAVVLDDQVHLLQVDDLLRPLVHDEPAIVNLDTHDERVLDHDQARVLLGGERADECVAVRLERTGRAGKARQDR